MWHCFTLLCVIYGIISNNPYEITLIPEVIFFLLFFFVNFIEYLWKNRKKQRLINGSLCMEVYDEA